MALTRHSGRHVPPEHKSMLWYGYSGLICWAIAAVVGMLAGSAVGVLPEFTGYVVAGAAFLAGVALLILDSFVRRWRDRDGYRKAGFVVEPPNRGQRIDDLMVFTIFGSGPTNSDCHYTLPEAPEARAYDLYMGASGKIQAHLVTMPTSAPAGVAALHMSREAVKAKVGPGGYVTDATGTVRWPGEQYDVLVRALPPWPGILVVRMSRARWLTYQRLTPDEIKTVIACLQRLPPPAMHTALADADKE